MVMGTRMLKEEGIACRNMEARTFGNGPTWPQVAADSQLGLQANLEAIPCSHSPSAPASQ